MRVFLAILLVALAHVPTAASAATFFTNGVGLARPGTSITFDEADPALEPLTIISQANNPYSAFGFSFFVAVYQPLPGIFDGGYVGNFLPDPLQIAQNFVIFFDRPQSRAAFKLFTGAEETRFEAYLGQTLVENAIVGTGPDTDRFYGFDGVEFDAIQITPGVDGARNGALLDDLQFGSAVPEPASWMMLVAGFGLAGTTLRRQQPSARRA